MQAISTTGTGGTSARRPAWTGDLGIALLGAAVSLLLSLASGVNKLADPGGDSDSLMRLVQVRDLLGGQGWFDLTQYRMGPAGGFEMHWSRLVDAPIAAMIRLAELATGDAGRAEMIVAWLWPALLLAVCLFLLVRSARALGGGEAVFPAFVLGLAALHFLGIFAPGSFDHHNVQLALVLAAVTTIVGRPGLAGGVAAGFAAALSLAVGMETAPLVASIGAAVALALLIRGEPERPVTTGFGLGFAGAALIASVATLPPSRWVSVTCDAWSGAQAGTAILAGAGIALIAAIPLASATLRARIVALAALAAVVAVFAITAFPACLADPYASLDPLLKRYWLDWVTEAQGALSLIVSSPGEAAGYFITPLIALAVLAVMAVRGVSRRSGLIIALVLTAAFAVSLWQVRGAMFAAPLAVIPLAAMVGDVRSRAQGRSAAAGSLMLVVGWLASFNIAWGMGVGFVADATSGRSEAAPGASEPASACYGADEYEALSDLQPTTVLAVSNLGTSILYTTDHRVLSGPYHRNVQGNLAALRALTAEPEEAWTILSANGVGIIAHCPGNSETQVLAAQFPQSLIAALVRGETPDWLEPLATDPDDGLRLFHIVGRRFAYAFPSGSAN